MIELDILRQLPCGLLVHSSVQVTFDIYGHLFPSSTQGVADGL